MGQSHSDPNKLFHRQCREAYFGERKDSDDDHRDHIDAHFYESLSQMFASHHDDTFAAVMSEFQDAYAAKKDGYKTLRTVINEHGADKELAIKCLDTVMGARKTEMSIKLIHDEAEMKKAHRHHVAKSTEMHSVRVKLAGGSEKAAAQATKRRNLAKTHRVHGGRVNLIRGKEEHHHRKIDAWHAAEKLKLQNAADSTRWLRQFIETDIRREKRKVLKKLILRKIHAVHQHVAFAKHMKENSIVHKLHADIVHEDKTITNIAKLAGEPLVINTIPRHHIAKYFSGGGGGDEKEEKEMTKRIHFELRIDDDHATLDRAKIRKIRKGLAALTGMDAAHFTLVSQPRAGSIIANFETDWSDLKRRHPSMDTDNKKQAKKLRKELYTNPAFVSSIDSAMSFVKKHMQNRNPNEDAFYLAQKCVAIIASHTINDNAHNILHDHLLQTKAKQDEYEIEMDPAWDRTYGEGHTHWTGQLHDSADRGHYPYFCPSGWRRYSLRVPGFKEKTEGWSIGYHGTQNAIVGSILSHGIAGPIDREQKIKCNETFFSPSIEYCAHPRYSTPQKLKGGKGYMQMIFQCRVNVNSDKFYHQGATFGLESKPNGGPTLDPNFDDPKLPEKYRGNQILEFVLKKDGYDNGEPLYYCYGIMVRISKDPAALPSSQWWKWGGDDFQRSILILGSGGDHLRHGAKRKIRGRSDITNELAVEQDVERSRKRFVDKKGIPLPIFGRGVNYSVDIYEVLISKGKARMAKFVQQVIRDFFEAADKNTHLTIYYTGHGDQDGDWFFNDDFITFEFMWDLIQKKMNANPRWLGIRVYADCCHSGHWVNKAAKKDISSYKQSRPFFPTFNTGIEFYAASAPNKSALDRVFSYWEFVGHNDKDNRKKMRDSDGLWCVNGVVGHYRDEIDALEEMEAKKCSKK